MVGVFVLVAIADIMVAYFIGNEFEFIAKEKGYTSKRYFWWTFLFGLVGIPMVIALPDRRKGAGTTSGSAPVNDDEIPEI